VQKIEIGEDDDERRLDALLRRWLALPRSLAMKLIRTGEARVNGARAEAGRKLAIGDVVEVRGVAGPGGGASGRGRGDRGDRGRPAARDPGEKSLWSDSTLGADANINQINRQAPAENGLRPAAAGARPPSAARLSRAILFEDADILVFDKPPGLVSHAGSGHERGAVELLLDYLGRASGPALVNRLDRDTSGLLVLAKTPLALRRLNATIRRGGLAKGYLALVRGAPAPPEGEVRAALRKERGADGLERMAVVPEGPGALAALTRYRTERRVARGGAALLALEPETGRTHQLRAHLASIGHPIALDRKYGHAAWNREIEARCGLARLFLHAATLAFAHPRTAEPVRFAAPLPPDLARALERLEAPPRAGA
jgi:23S rRNA pseudouridine955/2504/2580 synthase